MEQPVPGLRYVTDDLPGIRRVRTRKGFSYRDPGGHPVRDRRTLERIQSLAIPPAYEHVWISPIDNAHIQATGRDARGRKQYRYHPRWRAVRDESKFARMVEFAKALPAIRRSVNRDLRKKGLVRERVLATVVRLLETTAIRVGSDEYARENKSFGLTTLHNKHATVRGGKIEFHFRGKRGIAHAIALNDPRLARIVRDCQDLPGQRLFEYVDDEGAVQPVDSNDVNEYIRAISGGDFTAKDFRTWVATVLCSIALCAAEKTANATEAKHTLNRAIEHTARCLGNTPAICRKSYIHPRVIEAYLERGELGPISKSAERFVVALLKNRRRRPKR